MHPIQTGGPPEAAPRTLTPRGGRVPLAWVPEERVPAVTREFVARHVRRLAAQLGLKRPVTVRWFGQPVGGADFYGDSPAADCIPMGFAPGDQPYTIGLLRGLQGPELVDTLAHECHALFERQHSGGHDEALAGRFARKYVEAWESRRG